MNIHEELKTLQIETLAKYLVDNGLIMLHIDDAEFDKREAAKILALLEMTEIEFMNRQIVKDEETHATEEYPTNEGAESL